VDRIRVVITSMPQLLQDIVYAILSVESDLELTVATPPLEATGLVEAFRDADVVIVPEPVLDSMACKSLLYAHPHIRVVAIAEDGRRAMLYELRPTRVPLGELSSQVLVEAVRTLPSIRKVS
jgi:hypothetical protein